MRLPITLVWFAAYSLLAFDSNLSCVERLEVPGYPRLAAQADLGLVISATVVLAPDATIQETKLTVAGPFEKRRSLFAPAVQSALARSTFQRACAGKSISLVFHFVLDDHPKYPEYVDRISFVYPNQFKILTRRPHFQP